MNKEAVDMQELLKQYRKFEKASSTKFKDFKERIKNDRDFLGGEHYEKSEDTIFGKKRYKSSLDITSNTIRSIVNQYSANPYSWLTPDSSLTDKGSAFLNESTAKASIIKGLKNCVSYGLGYLNNTTVIENGQLKPSLYSIPDVTKVYYDPDSTEIDGSDATQCIIVDLKSKDWVKRTYGEEILFDLSDNGPMFDISDYYNKDDQIPVITYYVKEPDVGVIVYKIINSSLVEDPIIMNINRIPIVPIYGEEIFKDGDVTYRGIVSQTKPIQKLIDFTYSQLCERLAKSPKNAWIATREAIEGNEEYFKNFDKSINELLMYNKFDKRQRPNEKPERVDMSCRFDDLTTIMGNTIGLMQNITGVAAAGIPDERAEITATEALLNAKSFANNVRNYFENLKQSIKACGEIFFQLIGTPVPVRVTCGPEDELQRQCARAELTNLVAMAPEDKKIDLLKSITSTMDTNQFVKNFNDKLNAGPSPEVQQLQQMMQQMTEQTKQQLAQAQEQYKALENEYQKSQAQLLALQSSNEASITMKAMELQSKERIALAELNLKYQTNSDNNETKLQEQSMKNKSQEYQELIKADQRMKNEIVGLYK